MFVERSLLTWHLPLRTAVVGTADGSAASALRLLQHSLCLLWRRTLPVPYPVVAWNFQPQPERASNRSNLHIMTGHA